MQQEARSNHLKDLKIEEEELKDYGYLDSGGYGILTLGEPNIENLK